MKNVSSLLTATVFASSLLAPAFVQADSQHPAKTGSPATHHHLSAATKFKGEHTMQGAISKIDHTTGTVDLRTQDGTLLTLHFPANAIQDLKTGDQVTVKMEIAKTSGAAAIAPSAMDKK